VYVYDDYVMERIQVLLDPRERELFRRLARQRGLSLSAWLRDAALRQSVLENEVPRLRTVDALRAFFAECDAREHGREPDWEEHLAVIDTSRREGLGVPSAMDSPPAPRPTRGETRHAVEKRTSNRKR
jgi:hypothetical protein